MFTFEPPKLAVLTPIVNAIYAYSGVIQTRVCLPSSPVRSISPSCAKRPRQLSPSFLVAKHEAPSPSTIAFQTKFLRAQERAPHRNVGPQKHKAPYPALKGV